MLKNKETNLAMYSQIVGR